MSLLDQNKYLFELPYPDNTEENFRNAVREFMIADENLNFPFMNKVYDIIDFQEYR